uniref:Sulfhydryl oxidase n=1 Tax=Hyaloperonospora arabidopsidis (strain Emoy2) TaxID=559515 RepID=M4BH74_HYAAE
MPSTRKLLLVPWTASVSLLYPASSFSLLKQETSPLFTKTFQVHSLDAQNYDTTMNDSDIVWLVDYYAPWCPHCRQFAPEWEKVAMFYSETSEVQVGAVDCTKNSEICNQEDIRGYPGVKLHHVPAYAERAQIMPRSARTSKKVIIWAEKLMGEYGIESGMDVENLDARLSNFRKNGVVVADGDEDMILYSDQSSEMKYNRLHDAGIAVVSTFENGFFMGADVLEGERYEIALMWVTALAASFPGKMNRQVLVMLVQSVMTRKHWEHAEWTVMLQRWQKLASDKTFPVNLFASSEYRSWALCKTYTCGLWTLFHTITASKTDVTEISTEEPWKPSKIMAAIRLYIENFFGCEECREHFMRLNPASIIDKLAAIDIEEPHAVVLWIWRMHNTVNENLKKDQWPSRKVCPVCYVENGEPISLDPAQLHAREIVAYVTSAYGQDDEEILAMEAIQNGNMFALRPSMDIFSSMMIVLVLFALLGVAYATKNHRTYSHKTIMTRRHLA